MVSPEPPNPEEIIDTTAGEQELSFSFPVAVEWPLTELNAHILRSIFPPGSPLLLKDCGAVDPNEPQCYQRHIFTSGNVIPQPRGQSFRRAIPELILITRPDLRSILPLKTSSTLLDPYRRRCSRPQLLSASMNREIASREHFSEFLRQ